MTTAETTTPADQEHSEEAARALFRGPFKTIAAALVAAQLNAKAVSKDAKNKYHNYKYASAEALIEEARAALNSAGLATIMEHWEILPPLPGGGPPPSDNAHDDTPREFQRVKIHFKTVHADSDQTLSGTVEYHIVPEKGRPDDKATATALTYAEGYYLRGLLCLPRVDAETDVNQRNDAGFDPSRRRRPQDRPQGRGQQGRPVNGQQNRQQQNRVPAGNQNDHAPNGQQQRPQQPANGQSPAQSNGHANNQTNQSPPNSPPARSDRYRWWAGKIVGNLPPEQLRGMVAAIKKDERLTDESERSALIRQAENEAGRRENAQAIAGDPPVGRPRDETSQV